MVSILKERKLVIMTNNVEQILKKLANHKQAQILQRFFKTGKGEYGAGDIFLGVKVPVQRVVAKKNKDLELNSVEKLLHSKFHECRLTALFILVNKYKKSSGEEKKKIVDLYLKNLTCVNNWDLVDSSAPHILGEYLSGFDGENRKILCTLAHSKNLWQRRVAIITTQMFIRHNDFKDTLKIARILLLDKHDLIHKAVGWMLREVGQRDLKVEEDFLRKYYQKMPRTMLRYAIEKFPPQKQSFYLTR